MDDAMGRFARKAGIQGGMCGKVLVTDGWGRVGLCILRSMAKRNIETTIITPNPAPLSSFSRYSSEEILCPSPALDSKAFLAAVIRLLKKRKYDLMFPILDTSLILLSDHRDELSPLVKMLLPSRESVREVYDKSLTIRVANEEGVPTPKTFFIHDMVALKDVASKVTYPMVIKPKWSWIWNQNRAFHRRPGYANSASELVSSYEVIHRDFPFPMVQEYVPGPNISVAAIVNNGEPKAVCCIKVHRTLPVTGGNSVLRETVPPEPRIVKYASKLLRRLGWHGVAEVEFKVDERDSVPKLMEINGRFWGSLQLAVDSGIDFPYLLYRLAIDGRIQPTFNYNIGVKERWVNGDISHLLAVLRGEPKTGVPRPSRLRTVLQFLKFYEQNIHYDNFSFGDSAPFFTSLYRDISTRLFESLSRGSGFEPLDQAM